MPEPIKVKVEKIDSMKGFLRVAERLVYCYGITTEAKAEAWGVKHQHPTVYWHKRLQRAYAIKGATR